eukprot:TRINITY_DN16596_c0_g1_i1.p1 TRINITY_DN16596_c0_g1~~TRINITY_DN16596_c0_g1_i1.p1  ORF type:complete len:402 (+),score=52.87 TRINITY_DN16596_c0_g1_i1:22-1206(+)
MHAPLPLDSKPLQYHSHLCNNVPAVLSQTAALQEAFGSYISSLRLHGTASTSHADALRGVAGSVIVGNFTELSSMYHAIGHVQSTLLKHSEWFSVQARKLQELVDSQLVPTLTMIQNHSSTLVGDQCTLDGAKAELIQAVIQARERYEEAAAEGAESAEGASDSALGDRLRHKLRSHQVNRQLKRCTSAYLEAVEQLQKFLPRHTRESTQLLREMELNDRQIVMTIRDSLRTWVDDYSELCTRLQDDLGHLRETFDAVDIDADVELFVANNHRPPDPDPGHVYKFHPYEAPAASPASSRALPELTQQAYTSSSVTPLSVSSSPSSSPSFASPLTEDQHEQGSCEISQQDAEEFYVHYLSASSVSVHPDAGAHVADKLWPQHSNDVLQPRAGLCR